MCTKINFYIYQSSWVKLDKKKESNPPTRGDGLGWFR